MGCPEQPPPECGHRDVLCRCKADPGVGIPRRRGELLRNRDDCRVLDLEFILRVVDRLCPHPRLHAERPLVRSTERIRHRHRFCIRYLSVGWNIDTGDGHRCRLINIDACPRRILHRNRMLLQKLSPKLKSLEHEPLSRPRRGDRSRYAKIPLAHADQPRRVRRESPHIDHPCTQRSCCDRAGREDRLPMHGC